MTANEVPVQATARTRYAIQCSTDNVVPTRIEIIKAGNWGNSAKGNITISIDDLYQFKMNFDAGIGLPKGLKELPIDYSHRDEDKAAGWIYALEVIGDTLFGDVKWTPAGARSLQDGEYRCFSPSFVPGCFGEWHDPENYDITARNVLLGAGLTNIPFFKDLTAIMADNKAMLFINQVKGASMNLADILSKNNDDRTEEEKNFLVEHKDELTDEQKAANGFEVASTSTEETVENVEKNKEPQGGEEVTEEQKQAMALQASVKAGETVVVNASQWDETQKVIASYIEKEQTEFVDQQIASGKIKADKRSEWVKRLVQASSEQRESYKAMFDDIAANPVLASTQGENGGGDATQHATAVSEVDAEARKLITAAREANEVLDYGTAVSKVIASNKELATRYEQEVRG